MAHGASDRRAIKAAIGQAVQAVRGQFVDTLRAALAETQARLSPAAATPPHSPAPKQYGGEANSLPAAFGPIAPPDRSSGTGALPLHRGHRRRWHVLFLFRLVDDQDLGRQHHRAHARRVLQG